MTGHPLSPKIRARVIKLRADDPELAASAIALRLGISRDSVSKILQEAAKASGGAKGE